MDDDLITIAKDTRRIGKDVRSAISALDAKFNRLIEDHARRPRDGSLVTRLAACQLLALVEKRRAIEIAARLWPHDIELRTAVAPAMTSVAGWSAELPATAIADINSSLLGPSVFSQLRALSAVSYDPSPGHAIRAPSHQSAPSGSFVGEGQPINAGALLISAVDLRLKKCASIVAVSREVLRGSAANVQTSLQQLLSEDLSMAVDTILLDAVAADAIRPAGLRAGVAGLTPATGTPTEKAAADVGALVGAIMPASKPVLIAAGRQATSLGAFMPGMLTIVAPLLSAGTLICVDANSFANIVGPIDIAASGEPVLHMSDAALPIGTPGSPNAVSAPASNMFQIAATSLRCVLDINWSMRRSGAVAWMRGVGW